MPAGPKEGSATTLYTPEQRRRRDRSRWTLAQGVLAPLQFLVFLISLALVLRYLATGTGHEAASVSIVVKTFVLYTIMVTGALWERDVFGVYLFAPAFYWEDVVSFVVIALHTAYLVVLFGGWLTPGEQMLIALAQHRRGIAAGGGNRRGEERCVHDASSSRSSSAPEAAAWRRAARSFSRNWAALTT